jgi:hypothetical protein
MKSEVLAQGRAAGGAEFYHDLVSLAVVMCGIIWKPPADDNNTSRGAAQAGEPPRGYVISVDYKRLLCFSTSRNKPNIPLTCANSQFNNISIIQRPSRGWIYA